MCEPRRRNFEYKDGELEVILSLAPTEDNIRRLAKLLERSEGAIEIVYKIAYEKDRFGQGIQREKVFDAKRILGIKVGGVRA